MENAKRCDVHVLFADVVVLSDSSVLLIQPAHPPAEHLGWRLPGDALRHGEHPEKCAARILTEQLGLQVGWLELAEIESIPGELWHLFFHYKCEADRPPVTAPEIAEARFFQLEHLPPTAHGTWERDVVFRVVVGGGGAEEA
ncbi:MAG TPA: NUDIX domain-containing protein [bacterium]|nr:NUDIX domain-containing protein [bacterium]